MALCNASEHHRKLYGTQQLTSNTFFFFFIKPHAFASCTAQSPASPKLLGLNFHQDFSFFLLPSLAYSYSRILSLCLDWCEKDKTHVSASIFVFNTCKCACQPCPSVPARFEVVLGYRFQQWQASVSRVVFLVIPGSCIMQHAAFPWGCNFLEDSIN